MSTYFGAKLFLARVCLCFTSGTLKVLACFSIYNTISESAYITEQNVVISSLYKFNESVAMHIEATWSTIMDSNRPQNNINQDVLMGRRGGMIYKLMSLAKRKTI